METYYNPFVHVCKTVRLRQSLLNYGRSQFPGIYAKESIMYILQDSIISMTFPV